MKEPPVDDGARALIAAIRRLADETRPGSVPRGPIRLDASLERDLGIDSLGRAELLSRVEASLGVRLPGTEFMAAETPRDLLDLVARATPARARSLEERDDVVVGVDEAAAVPEHAATLPEVLRWHVGRTPDRPHVRIVDEDGREATLTYGGLLEGARAVAGGLRGAGLEVGDSVGVMLPTGREYLFTFWGVLLAGGVPVPIYPPARPSQIEEHLRRHARILANAETRLLVAPREARAVARLLKTSVDGLRRVATPEELSGRDDAVQPHAPASGDIALLQYTSGSTGDPKGVVLTHANLLANIRAMGALVRPGPSEVFVSWLPLYHDMGLIGAWLGTLYFGSPLVLMSPISFLSRPARWLWTIHRHRAAMSAGPNFAYELCASRIEDSEIEGLDLSSLRIAFSGAEPVSPQTVKRFGERFARHGFSPSVLTPVYGLAESAVGLAFPPLGRGPVVDRIGRLPFTREGRAVPADEHETDALGFVGCGFPIPGHEIRIVDATGREVAERQEGRLEFRGPSATSGYFRNPEATRRLRRGDWLDSGDLAYTAGGEVYVTGRVKDVIIRAGRNIYPAELEDAVGGIPGIRRGCVAAFASHDPATATERLIVVAETRRVETSEREALRARIREAAVDLLGVPPDDIVTAPPGAVLKTSSGKIRRAATRDLYERGRLGRAQRALWWQLVRLGAAGLGARSRRAWRLVADVAYSGYAWALLFLVAPPLWLAVMVLPGPSRRRALVRRVASLLVALSGTRVRVEGLERIPRTGPYVLAANHASYLDFLILAAVLPHEHSPVAKREFEKNPLFRVFFRRIGAEYVERFDPSKGVEDTRRLTRAVRDGRKLMFFPEGTFTRMPGLLPFQMGAFVVASEAGVPLVPVALRGTRSLLRSDQWILRRGDVAVHVGEPILPEGRSWSAAVALRDAARARILGACGEPDLAGAAPRT